MRESAADLHGSAPDKCPLALLIVDVINALDFPEADELLESALPMAQQLKDFKLEVQKLHIPVIYANDNFGRWRSDLQAYVDYCLESDVRGRPIVELLRPDQNDYCVLKPKHSAFFSTTLDTLLRYLEARTLIITGLATNICVLFTANDAYMRDFRLMVPRDCVAANSPLDSEHALQQMHDILKADTRSWRDLPVEKFAAGD